MNYTNDHVWIDAIIINKSRSVGFSVYKICKYCGISKFKYRLDYKYPKCLSEEEKIIKDIIE